MFIRLKDLVRSVSVLRMLRAKLEKSRFTAHVSELYNHPRHRYVIEVRNVRLRERKEYCGQHPCACPVLPFLKRHQTGRWLEGADWIGFNDMLNDVLDRCAVSADVWSYNREAGSGKYFIRRDEKRRTRYMEAVIEGIDILAFRWDITFDPLDFEDYCGRKAPRSDFPYGTPGLAEWRRGREPAVRVH